MTLVRLSWAIMASRVSAATAADACPTTAGGCRCAATAQNTRPSPLAPMVAVISARAFTVSHLGTRGSLIARDVVIAATAGVPGGRAGTRAARRPFRGARRGPGLAGNRRTG